MSWDLAGSRQLAEAHPWRPGWVPEEEPVVREGGNKAGRQRQQAVV